MAAAFCFVTINQGLTYHVVINKETKHDKQQDVQHKHEQNARPLGHENQAAQTLGQVSDCPDTGFH